MLQQTPSGTLRVSHTTSGRPRLASSALVGRGKSTTHMAQPDLALICCGVSLTRGRWSTTTGWRCIWGGRRVEELPRTPSVFATLFGTGFVFGQVRSLVGGRPISPLTIVRPPPQRSKPKQLGAHSSFAVFWRGALRELAVAE
ncbi:hypothetical protein Aduo_008829 [Ancylostoma duodenale]